MEVGSINIPLGTSNTEAARIIADTFTGRVNGTLLNLNFELEDSDRPVSKVDATEIDAELHRLQSGLFFVRQVVGGLNLEMKTVYTVGTITGPNGPEEIQLA